MNSFLYRLKLDDALGLERLHGIGFQLVGAQEQIVLGPASTVENEQPLGVLLPITARFEALRGPDSESIQPRLLNNIFSMYVIKRTRAVTNGLPAKSGLNLNGYRLSQPCLKGTFHASFSQFNSP